MAIVLILKRKREMNKTLHNYSKIGLLVVALCAVFSCTSDDNLAQLDATIFVRHKDADMPAYIHGNATDKTFLIILHGGPGGNGLSYRDNAIKTEIEKNCAVVYFDQRGSGMSQGGYNAEDLTIDIMVDDVLALVKVIYHKYGSDSKLFLMGHSWGGTLGSATLIKDESDFSGWIEVDGAHNPKGLYFEYISNFKNIALEQMEAGNSLSFWEDALDLVANVNPDFYNETDFFKLNIKAHKADDTFRNDNIINKPPETISNNLAFKYNILTMLWTGDKTQSILRDKGLWETVDYTSNLSEITIPSLVLWGKHDAVVPPYFAQEAFDNLGSSKKELVLFEKSGHSPMFNEPDLFAEKVIQFINENK